MTRDTQGLRHLREENAALRREVARLQEAVSSIQDSLREPAEIIRAIQSGEVDAVVVQHQEEEQIYSIQRYDALYRGLIEEALPYGVWLTDQDGRVIYISRSFLTLTGTSLAAMRDKGQFHFLPEDIRVAFNVRWARHRETGEPCDFEYAVQGNDGVEHTILTKGILTYAYDGTPCWAGINLDVTQAATAREELRRKAEALQDADRRKDEFLALLGHELRNPLAVIRHGLDLLLMQEGQELSTSQTLAMMDNQVIHLTRLLDDLLDVARITSGRIQLRKEQAELTDLVDRALQGTHELIEAKGHTVTISLPPTPVYLVADPVRVAQVLVNLLNNAAKYTPPGGRIDVTAVVEGDSVAIRVQDNGMGIRPEMLPKVFDLFFQSDKSLKLSQGGLGIGLTLVRQLVALHGGSVSAQSAGLGQGSVFTVRLPVAAVLAEAAPPVRSPDGVQQEGPSLRILLVDDQPDLGMLFEMLLRNYGHQVRTVYDGPSALAAAPEFQPGVVLLDIGLPGMDGYEVAKKMRQMPSLSGTVIAAMTGYGQDSDRQRSQEAGIDHHLVKPVSFATLRPVLEAAAQARPR